MGATGASRARRSAAHACIEWSRKSLYISRLAVYDDDTGEGSSGYEHELFVSGRHTAAPADMHVVADA
jgi:hypothetical protein